MSACVPPFNVLQQFFDVSFFLFPALFYHIQHLVHTESQAFHVDATVVLDVCHCAVVATSVALTLVGNWRMTLRVCGRYLQVGGLLRFMARERMT